MKRTPDNVAWAHTLPELLKIIENLVTAGACRFSAEQMHEPPGFLIRYRLKKEENGDE